MTPDLDKLKELVAKATALPWEESDGERGPNFYLEIRGPYDGDVNGDTGQHIVVGGEPICSFLDNERDYQDCALIIAVVNSLPTLIAKAERVDAMTRIMQEIEKHATMANNVIRLNRDGGGNGRVKVATCMHHIERLARNALSPKESE